MIYLAKKDKNSYRCFLRSNLRNFLPVFFERYHCCLSVIIDCSLSGYFSVSLTLNLASSISLRLLPALRVTLAAFFCQSFDLSCYCCSTANATDCESSFFILRCFLPYICFSHLVHTPQQPAFTNVFMGVGNSTSIEKGLMLWFEKRAWSSCFFVPHSNPQM